LGGASLRPPGLGPIVGATTDTTCRIWIRADDPEDAGARLNANRRTVGILGIVGKNDKITQSWYFRLSREFDRTGAFLLGNDVALGDYITDVEARSWANPGKRKQKPAEARPLQPDTEYRVRAATLTIDDPLPDEETLADWQLRDRLPDTAAIQQELMEFQPEVCEATFRTFKKASETGPLAFLVGSCRYPGLLWKIKEADRIFGPMFDHFDDDRSVNAARFTLMVGDQIYADVLNKNVPVLRADTYEEFQERYLTAYGAPNLRRLMRRSPTFMILDDHEIEDNWTQDQLRDNAKHLLFNVAISAYMNYQWSHGPRTFGQYLYYSFDCGSYPFFVVDTRTQRFKDDHKGLRDNYLLGRPTIDPRHPSQLRRLLDWLTQCQKERGNVPKFIATSSVFVPNAMNERLDPYLPPAVDAANPRPPFPESVEKQVYEANRLRREDSDSWPAYPKTRGTILKHIVENKIQNVVFLAGDIHCSNVAEMEFDGEGSELRAFSITSSAFYWPFPFADGDPNGYVHDSKDVRQMDPFPILGTSSTMNYRSFGFTQEDNFTRVDVDPRKHALTVTVFGSDGTVIKTADASGKEVDSNVLKLVPW
jgi:alkaline phosphatase D